MITMDLRDLSSVEKMNVLTEIDQAKSGSPEAVAFLRQCLFAEDYLVRSRCFALLERYWFPPLRESLLEIVKGEGDRQWQLRALAALARSGDDSLCRDLEPLVFQRNKPLLLRGALWVVATLGGEDALDIMARFLRSPYRGYLKPSFVADAMALAIGNTEGGETFWKLRCEKDPDFSKIVDYYRGFVTENPLLQVYPYPDYLSKAAMEQDISPKELKRAIYFKNRR